MQFVSEHPPRDLSAADIEAFHRDGAVVVRGLYSPHWVALLAAALDDITSKPSAMQRPHTNPKFRTDAFVWLSDDRIRDFVFGAPTVRIVQQAFGSHAVHFFYDQIFVKESLTPDPTPWHHDYTFWPIEGTQMASIWTSVDAVTPDSSALEFVAGSHRWPNRFKAIGARGMPIGSTEGLDDVPDVEADRSKFDILSWDLEPGDAILFHSLVLHGSRGNNSAVTKRRAITTRWCGDDVVYQPIGQQMPILWKHGLRPGDPLSGPVFPQVYPATLDAELAARARGPIAPDADLIQDAKKGTPELFNAR